ncbi:DNA-binding response regulator, OmpR family, contains REC and winged-helix (wHTH) domain [Ectothiorhodosinus mongolicus]|uniref:DNA-binding response regulator, OmpR family, contains REC and winged-helix (WHTH) domain n=1 Tax=Ectothiorhodosinus mongolicus TaxID=233100 RepID=A0A1R3VMB6_9GAMM|nr:response regulator transcription factor [Ectothiorhodosinus mongolicus]ULX57826.1 DNA-binding response regulator [Ectothiorhodosinus mongolicus]SIT65697.1 DNA-binding response regulator, OmpR family, contains REC and winged-helix (wHTH) domain [Ectothiorhodosinus mongolicus]
MNQPAQKSIAIVEDDRGLREELACFFEDHGYTAHEAISLEGLMEILQLSNPEVVILDLNLPGKSGLEIARELRQRVPSIGIIMLTARNQLNDRIKGYDTGADIYLTKPTDPEELLAAVTSLSRRVQGTNNAAWNLDIKQHALSDEQEAIVIELTQVETAILKALVLAPNGLMDAGELLGMIEEQFPDRAGTRRSLENIISRLRKKTTEASPDISRQAPIKAHRNAGYQLTIPLQIKP